MDMNVFATSRDVVDTYFARIDEKKLKKVQAEIDEWNGRGELKEKRAAGLFPSEPFAKLEIVSKKPDGRGEIFYYCCPAIETVDMYKYKYYEFRPHQLSKMCDQLVKNYEPIELSRHIAAILNWETDDEKEKQFISEILNTITFQKLSVDDIVQSDLSPEYKKNLLQRIIDAVKNIPPKKQIIASSKTYEEEVDKHIQSMEWINTGFYGRELKGQEFKYTPEQRVAVKKKIFNSLPKSANIPTTLNRK